MEHLDLFSGYGGFTIPAKKYGIETIGFSEIDKYACSVLNYHYPNIKNYGDITKIKGEDLPTVDIITGGSPCQDLSVAGKGAGLNGERSGLFFHFIRLIKEKQPTYFVWENVKGALSSQRGWDFARVQIEMEQAGYDVWWQVLNAKDFGVPQNRERIFAVGIRRGSGQEILLEQRESRQNLEFIGGTEHRTKWLKDGKRKSRNFSQGDRVYSPEGIATNQNANGGGLGAKTGLYCVGSIDVVAKKRMYGTPVMINKYLREKRKSSIREVANKLQLPKTQVEHYFRTDKSRTIPSPKVWKKLKNILNLDDRYDEQVTKFYKKEVEFESTRRVYDSKGVAKTTDTSGTGLYCVGIIPESVKPKGNYLPRERVFDVRGNARAVSTVGSQHPMYAIPNSNGNIHSLDANYWKGSNNPNKSRRSQVIVSRKRREEYNLQEQSPALTSHCRGFPDGDGRPAILRDMRVRRLTPIECERLMGLEDNWTAKGRIDGKEVNISDTQRYKMCGNGCVINCVAYIYNLITKFFRGNSQGTI